MRDNEQREPQQVLADLQAMTGEQIVRLQDDGVRPELVERHRRLCADRFEAVLQQMQREHPLLRPDTLVRRSCS